MLFPQAASVPHHKTPCFQSLRDTGPQPMKWLALLLFFLLLLLQYRLWFAEGSLAEQHRLQAEIMRQQQLNEALRLRNRELEQEVLELQKGLETVEERARRDLGMIKRGEQYYQLVEKPPAPTRQTQEPGDE